MYNAAKVITVSQTFYEYAECPTGSTATFTFTDMTAELKAGDCDSLVSINTGDTHTCDDKRIYLKFVANASGTPARTIAIA